MININKLREILWLLHDQIQEEQAAAAQLQRQEAEELKQLLKGN